MAADRTQQYDADQSTGAGRQRAASGAASDTAVCAAEACQGVFAVDAMQRTVSSLLADLTSHQILRQRKEGLIARMHLPESRTVIVKLWARPGWRGMVRRLTRTGSAIREWRVVRRLHARGISVPRPLGYCRLSIPGTSYTDATFCEDLGPCTIATDRIKTLIGLGREDEVRQTEDEIIALTGAILQAGVIDTDHSMVNIVVPASGHAVRLDFELARLTTFRSLMWRSEGEMLGRLIATYTFAVQPETSRARDFAMRLEAAIGPSRRVLACAARHAAGMFEVQRAEIGIDTRLELGW